MVHARKHFETNRTSLDNQSVFNNCLVNENRYFQEPYFWNFDIKFVSLSKFHFVLFRSSSLFSQDFIFAAVNSHGLQNFLWTVLSSPTDWLRVA